MGGSIEVLLDAGHAHASVWDYVGAIQMYDRAARAAPDDWRPLRYRGHRFISIRRLPSALQDLEAARDLTKEEFRAEIARRLPPHLKDMEFVVDIASQDPRPLNPLMGPKRIAVYDPVSQRIEEQLLSGILEFVPAKAHLYRVFAIGREHERELNLAARAALEHSVPQSMVNL